jgi:hypothetical protein
MPCFIVNSSSAIDVRSTDFLFFAGISKRIKKKQKKLSRKVHQVLRNWV